MLFPYTPKRSLNLPLATSSISLPSAGLNATNNTNSENIQAQQQHLKQKQQENPDSAAVSKFTSSPPWSLLSTARSSMSSARHVLNQVKIINVKSNTARWQAMMAQLRAAGILSFQRVDAVDAAQMDDKTLRGLVTTDAYVRIKENKPRTSHAEISTKGQVACTLSHKSVWHDLAFTRPSAMEGIQQDYVFILEDDASIAPDTVYRIQQSLQYLPSDYDILLFGFIGYPTPLPAKSNAWSQVKRFYGCHAMIMTRKAAKALLNTMGPMECQLDTFVFQTADKLNLKIYAHFPPIVHQGRFPSTIQNKGDCMECGILI